MHRQKIAPLLLFVLIATSASAQQAANPENGFCVQNTSDHMLYFAVDNGDARLTQNLASGETLCTIETDTAQSGFVSAFESSETLEGCSRLVSAGTIEGLVRYADFDRCEWSSHS